MERQSFGFKYEADVCDRYHLTKSKKYTDPIDASDGKIGVQIKTYKNGGQLMMSSPDPYLTLSKPFKLIVACRDENKVLSEKTIIVNPEKLKALFKEEHFSERCKRLKTALSKVSNSHEDDKKWKSIYNTKLNNKIRAGKILQVQAKRDHKNQKRVQWAIASKNIDTFLNMISF